MRDGAGLPVGNGVRLAFSGVLGAVAADDDAVADAVVTIVVSGRGGIELGVRDEAIDDGLIERVDKLIGPSEQHGMVAGTAGIEPAVNRCCDRVGRSFGNNHPVVIEIGADSGTNVAVAKLAESCLFPRLLLTSVDSERRDVRRVCGGVCESSTGADLGELVVVADKEHPPTASELLGDRTGQRAQIGHASFVDDKQ